MTGLDASEYTFKAIIEAIRLGFPVYVKRLVRGAFLFRRENGGKGVVFSSWVPGEEEGYRYAALSIEPVTVWKHKVAKVSASGEVIELYPFNVARTAGQYVALFSTFEADVWYRRLLAYWRKAYTVTDSYPSIVRGFVSKCGCDTVLYFRETGDYALVKDGKVYAWFNLFTGRLDDSRPYLRAAGLL
jgi:hypothetical protein